MYKIFSGDALWIAFFDRVLYNKIKKMRCDMEDLKLNQFLNRADDFIINITMGGDPYRIKAQAGNAIIISEEEYERLKAGKLENTVGKS